MEVVPIVNRPDEGSSVYLASENGVFPVSSVTRVNCSAIHRF